MGLACSVGDRAGMVEEMLQPCSAVSIAWRSPGTRLPSLLAVVEIEDD